MEVKIINLHRAEFKLNELDYLCNITFASSDTQIMGR